MRRPYLQSPAELELLNFVHEALKAEKKVFREFWAFVLSLPNFKKFLLALSFIVVFGYYFDFFVFHFMSKYFSDAQNARFFLLALLFGFIIYIYVILSHGLNIRNLKRSRKQSYYTFDNLTLRLKGVSLETLEKLCKKREELYPTRKSKLDFELLENEVKVNPFNESLLFRLEQIIVPFYFSVLGIAGFLAVFLDWTFHTIKGIEIKLFSENFRLIFLTASVGFSILYWFLALPLLLDKTESINNKILRMISLMKMGCCRD